MILSNAEQKGYHNSAVLGSSVSLKFALMDCYVQNLEVSILKTRDVRFPNSSVLQKEELDFTLFLECHPLNLYF